MHIRTITSKLNYGYGQFKRVTEFGKFKDRYIAIEKDYQHGKQIDKTIIIWNEFFQRIFKKG